MNTKESTQADVLRRAREIFLAAGKNASILSAVKGAAAQLDWAGELVELHRLLRNATQEGDGPAWRIKTLDRAIERASA